MIAHFVKKSVAILITLCLLVLKPVTIAAQSHYAFTYFYVADFGKTQRYEVINPASASSQTAQATYPVPIGWHLATPRLRSVASPQGTWIASFLFAEDHSNRVMVHLYNPLTQEAREILDGYTTSHGELLAWSPDGQRLAMIFGSVNDSNVELYVYSVADDTLTNITHDKFEQRDITWSPDSQQIATFTVPCGWNEVCVDQVEIYAVSKATRVKALLLSTLPLIGNAACAARFSPNLRYVSFVSNCGYVGIAAYDFAREMMIWDVQRNELRQITDFYNAAGAKPFFTAAYSHLWLDNDTLLVGVDYKMQEPPRMRQLFTYQVSTNTLEVLSTEFGAGFVIDDAATRIALGRHLYLAMGDVDPTTTPISSSMSILPLEKSIFTKDNFEVEAAKNRTTLPYGCFYQWSPDASMLAVTIDATGRCFVNLSRVLILNTSGEVLREVEVPAIKSPDSFIKTIGWMQISQ